MSEVTLESLVGPHAMSGFDLLPDHGLGAEALFTLDGITYSAKEDPEDGYRSSLGSVTVTEAIPGARFAPVSVLCAMSDQVLVVTDTLSGRVVLTIGTDNDDDYYPSFCADWVPSNLHVNIHTKE